MKSPFSVTLTRLLNELVDAVVALVARSAGSSLKGKSGSLFDAGNGASARAAAPARGRKSRPTSKARSSGAKAKPAKPAKPSNQLSLFDAFAAPRPARDEAPVSVRGADVPFAITDPTALLAEVAPATPPPASRRRGRKPKGSTLTARPEAPPSVPAAPVTPALRDGEQVAKAILGGGVVVRRRRT